MFPTKLLNFLILSLLLIEISPKLTQSHSNIVPKESFIPLNSHEYTFFNLREKEREIYFSYENNFENSDIIVNLKIAKQFTTRAYFYDSYEAIKTDDKGQYIDFLTEIDLCENIIVLKNSETPIKKTTYYIIIKDVFDYCTKDYISIFNEQDKIELKDGEPFIINYFLSKNNYVLTFDGEIDEVITLNLNIDNSDFSEIIDISLNGEQIYQGERNKGIIKLNEKKNTNGTYVISISSANEETYSFIKSSIILYKQKFQVMQLMSNSTKELVYGASKNFSFYLDIDDYELDEENIITFKFSHNVYNKKLIDFCYAKTMNFESFDDNEFMSNMPAQEEETEADFSRMSSIDSIYHLYFKKTKEHEENKRSYLLVHCSISIDDELYLSPEKFNVYLNQRSTIIDLSEEQYLKPFQINQNIEIMKFTPEVYRIRLPVFENEFNKLSYVFYTNTKIQTVYENSMIGCDHKNEELRQIYALPYTSIVDQKYIYIKIFGAQQNINFRLEATKSQIYYINSVERPVKTYGKEHLNCGESFYYIGSYSPKAIGSNTTFYLEEIYGEYNIYYKGVVSTKDDDTILTNENSKYLLKEKKGALNYTFDIIELKCSSPGYFNLHLLKSDINQTIGMYSRNVGLIKKGATYIYPNKIVNQTDINLEISTPLGKKIEVYVYTTSNVYDPKKTEEDFEKEFKEENYDKYIIDNSNKYLQLKFNESDDLPNYIRLYAAEDSVISVRLTDDYLFKVVDSEHTQINEDRILFKINNSADYKTLNLSLSRIYHDYSYTLFRGDIAYATDPILSGYDYVNIETSTKINLLFSNPYNKPYSMEPDKKESPFYIMFYVYDPEGMQKDVYMTYKPIEQYELMPNSVSKLFYNEDKKYSININKDISQVSVIFQSCDNSLKGINIYSYDDVLNSFGVTNKYNLGIFNKYNLSNQIGGVFFDDSFENNYTGAFVGVSLTQINQSVVDKFNKLSLNVTQNGKKLKWEALDGAKYYDVYVFNKENENIKYIHNPCYLDDVKHQNITSFDYYLNDENDTEYIKNYTTKNNYYYLKEEGIYIVTVVASLEDSTPLKYIYNELEFDSNSPPYEEDSDESDPVVVVLIAIGGIIIYVCVGFILYYLSKKKSTRVSLPEGNEKLVRDTYTVSVP